MLTNCLPVMQCWHGSPSNCKVQDINAKEYSAGGLIKITNGFKVSKINQQDSCPVGWKIWSPIDKADWTAVYNALGKSIKNYPRKPDLLVDVTRNTNGCGGCKNYAMNSYVIQQSSWRTSDGSSWWLRDSKFNQPAGNYYANCFLRVYDVDPKNVRFNYGSCASASTDYLCQPAKPYPYFPRRAGIV